MISGYDYDYDYIYIYIYSPRYGAFLVIGVLVHIAQFLGLFGAFSGRFGVTWSWSCAVFGAFWRLFGPFLGHIVELEGTKGPLVARKSFGTCSVAAVCLRLAVLNPY